jgi:uncharacterized protein YjbI with pentapeptide repeats
MEGANLSHANLQGADLSGANLVNCDLRGANLRGAVLEGATTGGLEYNTETAWSKDVDLDDLGATRMLSSHWS